jgi:hypothetical protein
MMLPCSHTALSIKWLLVKKQIPAYSSDVAPHYFFPCVFCILINLNMCRMWSNYERSCIQWFPTVLSGMAGVLQHPYIVVALCLEVGQVA